MVNKLTTFTINLGSQDDEVGGAIVSYKDEALKAERYDVGQKFHFWIKIA